MTPAASPKVVVGLQGAQMPANAIRGIGRWASLYLQSLVEHRRDLVAAVSVDRKLPLPSVLSLLPDDLPVVVSEERPPVANGESLVFHAVSVFEDLDLERIWPAWAQDPSVALAVTMHDTIPALYPEDYFVGSLRYLLESRYELLRCADVVIANSSQTRQDTVRLLGLDASRVVAVPVEPSARFRPYPPGRAAAHQLLPAGLGVRPDFVLSIGNVDPRKNLKGLLRAYACLPSRLRREHQLVLTCSQAGPEHLESLREHCAQLGVEDQVLLMSFVDEDTMVRLYQSCHTMIFPSFYEGLGLPVIEAMRCGACTLVGNQGATRELVHDPAGWFDPHDPADMGEKLRRVLEDEPFAEQRRAGGISDALRYTWEHGEAAVDRAYRTAVSRR